MDLTQRTLEQRVISAYADGSDIAVIAESFGQTKEQILEVLGGYKEANRFKRTFNDIFKMMIAERDLNGVTRSSIATELGININTVQKACEAFGQKFKEQATNHNTYTRTDGEFPKDQCPGCNSKRYNPVEERTYFCLSCGHEYIHNDDHVLSVNWEYLD